MRRRMPCRCDIRRLKGKSMKKFTIIDYLIIILVICGIAFAFVHITSDDSSDFQKTAFDSQTINKIPETYLNYYLEGKIVKVSVDGYNSTTGEEISTNGTVVWEDDDGGNDVKVLMENENGTFLLGTYKNNPNADIYIKTISLESNGDKYPNLTEIKLTGRNITSLKDLTSNIPKDSDYEISTKIAVDSLNPSTIQEISNSINSHNKRFAIKTANGDYDNQIVVVRADNETIYNTDSILGNVNGVSDEITIRIYNCSENQINSFKNSSDVIKIQNLNG